LVGSSRVGIVGDLSGGQVLKENDVICVNDSTKLQPKPKGRSFVQNVIGGGGSFGRNGKGEVFSLRKSRADWLGGGRSTTTSWPLTSSDFAQRQGWGVGKTFSA